MGQIKQLFIPSRLPFFYGWVILSVASLTMFISGPGQTFSFSVFVGPMREELGLSQTKIAVLYTAGSLTASAALVLVGLLLDRVGARVMLTATAILFGLATLWMTRVSNDTELFMGFAFMRLLGQGTLGLIATTLVAIWFIRLRGRVMAINSLGSAIGQAAYPPVIVLLIASLGWRDAWAVLGFVTLGALVLPAVLFVRRSPESMGLLPDGDRSSASQPIRPGRPARVVEEINYSLRQVVRTRTFWLLLFATSSQSFVSTGLIFNNNSFFDSKGLDTTVAASIFPVMAPTVLLGNFLAGFLSDRYPNRYLLAVAQLCLAIPMVWSFLITDHWHALVYGAMLGLAGGFTMTTNAVIFPNYYGRQHLGSIRGLSTTAMVGASALGPMPFAFLFEWTGGYTVPIQVFLAIPVLCAVAAIAAVPPTATGARPSSLGGE